MSLREDQSTAESVVPFADVPLQYERKLKLCNSQGLHARPAAFIVKLLRPTHSSVTFTYKRQTVDAHSVLHLLMLGAPRNAFITVCATGPDALETIEKLEKAFKQEFRDLEV